MINVPMDNTVCMRVFQTVNYKETGPKKHKMSVKK